MWDVISTLLTRYGLSTALAVVLAGAEAVFIFYLWRRNQELVTKLLAKRKSEGEGETEEGEAPATLVELDQALSVQTTQLIEALSALGSSHEAALTDLSERELRHAREQIERALERERSASREHRDDLKTLGREGVQSMEAATAAMERLTAMIEGAMRERGHR